MTKVAEKTVKCIKCGAESEQLVVYSVNFNLGSKEENEKLMKHKISSLPVVEDDKVIGIITATDVGHNLILDKYELGTSVEEIMISSVVTISPEDSLEKAIEVMKKSVSSSGILNQLPVVEDCKLVGIISDGDIIQEIL